MRELSLNSFFGMQSKKEPSAAGLLKISSRSLQGNQNDHGENSFRGKLENSMNNKSTIDDKNSTLRPSELNNKSNIKEEENNHLIDMASMGASTNITNNIHNDQMPLNQVLNRNIPVEALTNGIVNNNTDNGKGSPVQTQANTFPGHALQGNQGSSAINEPNINLAKIVQETTLGSQTEPPSTSIIDKLNTSQINSKTNEQNPTDILNRLNPATIAGTTGEEHLSQSSTTPGKQIAESHKGSNTNQSNQNNTNTNEQNVTDILNKLGTAKIAGTTGEEHLSQSSTIPGKQAAKTSDSNTDTLYQYNSKPAQTDSNESQKIFDIRPESAGAIVSKSPDSTTSIINSGVNSVNADEVLLSSNTSSNNSSFNSQGADTPNESYINAVTTSQKAEPGKNFTSTLSQINNPTTPFESLGSDTADNIVQKARLFMGGGKSEIKIQLNPPELGILKLEFAIEDDNLETKITVERSAVKDIIEKDIPRLRELLSNADLDVGKLDVSLQEKEDEKLSLMDKDLQSDSEGDSTKDLQDQDNEFLEDGIDEESIEYDEDSSKINILV